MKSYRVTEFLGDGISAELAKSVHQALASLPVKIELEPVDLSLAARQRDQAACYEHALKSLKRTAVALKYPTITEGESPNKILCERCGFAVIHRSCATIPGIKTHFTKPLDVDIVRVATGGTYEDQGRRIGLHSAVSVRVIEKLPCLLALSALLAHIGEGKIGHDLRLAVWDCLAQGRTTRDLGGKLGTEAFTRAVIDSFKAKLNMSGAAC